MAVATRADQTTIPEDPQPQHAYATNLLEAGAACARSNELWFTPNQLTLTPLIDKHDWRNHPL